MNDCLFQENFQELKLDPIYGNNSYDILIAQVDIDCNINIFEDVEDNQVGKKIWINLKILKVDDI